MNLNQSQHWLVNLSAMRSWLTFFAIVSLLGFIGLGWLVKSLLIMIALILLTPILLFVGLRWWLGQNLVKGACPSCGNPLTGLNNTQTTCPYCAQMVSVEKSSFQRPTEPGTIDVQAIEVTSQSVD